MRLIALLAEQPPGFSWGGTFEVVLFGFLVGSLMALVFLSVRTRRAITGNWPGPAVGAAVFVLFALVPPDSARSATASIPLPRFLTLGVFLPLLLLFGGALEWSARLLTRRKGGQLS